MSAGERRLSAGTRKTEKDMRKKKKVVGPGRSQPKDSHETKWDNARNQGAYKKNRGGGTAQARKQNKPSGRRGG